MKKILVPCDFSKPAINAYRFALNTIAKSRDVVHLIYIVEMPVMHDTMLMLKRMRDFARRHRLRKLAIQIQDYFGFMRYENFNL